MNAATTWVLLRGLGRGTGHWGDFPARLAQACPQGRVLALDLPGNGALHLLRSPARIGPMTEQVRAQLHALGVDRPVQLLALSLGGMVAVDWAMRYPQEVAFGVLINTSLRPFSAWFQRLRPRAWPALLRGALGRDPHARERAVLGVTSRLRGDDALVIAAWAALHRKHPVRLGNLLRQLRAATAFTAPCSAPTPPLVVLASTHDGLVDVGCSRRLAQSWGLPIVEHPAAGHDLPLDDADWLLRQILTWSPPQAGTV